MRNRFVPDSLQADADGSGHSIFRSTLAGSSVATTIFEFCKVMAPLLASRTVEADPSVVATSILSTWENAAGDWARSENVSCESCGSSSRLERWMLAALAPADPSLLPMRTALGRGDSTVALTS